MPAHRHQCGCWCPHPRGSTLSFPSAAGLRVFPIAALPFSFTEIICNVIILLGSAASSQPMRALGFMEFSKRRDGWKGAPTTSANGGTSPCESRIGSVIAHRPESKNPSPCPGIGQKEDEEGALEERGRVGSLLTALGSIPRSACWKVWTPLPGSGGKDRELVGSSQLLLQPGLTAAVVRWAASGV